MGQLDGLDELLGQPRTVYRGPSHVHAGPSSRVPLGPPAPARDPRRPPPRPAPTESPYGGDYLGLTGLDQTLTRGYRPEDAIDYEDPPPEDSPESIPLVARASAGRPLAAPPTAPRSHVAPPPPAFSPLRAAPSPVSSSERGRVLRGIAHHLREASVLLDQLAALEVPVAEAPVLTPPDSAPDPFREAPVPMTRAPTAAAPTAAEDAPEDDSIPVEVDSTEAPALG